MVLMPCLHPGYDGVNAMLHPGYDGVNSMLHPGYDGVNAMSPSRIRWC